MLKKQLELKWLSTRSASLRWDQSPHASRAEQIERWARLISRAARPRCPEEEEEELRNENIDE